MFSSIRGKKKIDLGTTNHKKSRMALYILDEVNY